jgi:hypothetical protein
MRRPRQRAANSASARLMRPGSAFSLTASRRTYIQAPSSAKASLTGPSQPVQSRPNPRSSQRWMWTSISYSLEIVIWPLRRKTGESRASSSARAQRRFVLPWPARPTTAAQCPAARRVRSARALSRALARPAGAGVSWGRRDQNVVGSGGTSWRRNCWRRAKRLKTASCKSLRRRNGSCSSRSRRSFVSRWKSASSSRRTAEFARERAFSTVSNRNACSRPGRASATVSGVGPWSRSASRPERSRPKRVAIRRRRSSRRAASARKRTSASRKLSSGASCCRGMNSLGSYFSRLSCWTWRGSAAWLISRSR